MGSQIACEYALGGHAVVLLGRDARRAAQAAEAAFELAEQAGLQSVAACAEARRRLMVLTDPHEVGSPPGIVVESVPEDLELKAAVLRPLAGLWPEATLATNTSSLSITALGAAVGAPSRLLGTHYWNPPLLMPLVEVVRGPDTSEQLAARTIETLRRLGKRPVLVRRDVPGFIWNRLQFALLREALWLLEHGVAGAEEIDEVVRDGLARRWRLTGPFETAELGGLATFARISANLFGELSTAVDAPALARLEPRDPDTLASIKARRDAALAWELRRDVDQPDGVAGDG